ncbi:MAG: DUF5320 domain-containing protein [Candidatus Cloacimonas sp.]|nr:DUF5320 domain-containing protein [Candidatus Cloacimonadota bacterium]
MPNYDGTGPYGDGRGGRGMGPCGRGYSNYGYGRRGGYYRGEGRPRRRFMDCLYPIGAGIREMFGNNKDYLKQRKSVLEEEIELINKRLNETGE